MDKELKEGTQVIYVPRHADGKIIHPDCEHGFVTSIKESRVFCRFWRKGTYQPFKEQWECPELRTTANSEACDIDTLVVMDYTKQKHVDQTLKAIKDGTLEV